MSVLNSAVASWKAPMLKVIVAVALVAGTATVIGGGVNAQSAPSTPSSVTLTRGNGFIDVSWPTVSGATGHNIVYSTNNRYSWTRAATNEPGTASGTNTTYRITSANNSSAYVVAVQATNSSGSSGWRNSDLSSALLLPVKAQNVSLSRTAAGQSPPTLTLTWDQCDMSQTWCNGGIAVTGYFVNLSSNGGHSWSRVKTITDPTTDSDVTTVTNPSNPVPASGFVRYSVDITTGIYNNLSYRASFGVQNAMGVAWANSSQAAANETALSSVSALTVHRGNAFFDLEWPTVTGATGYDINYSTDDRKSWVRAASNVTPTLSESTSSYRINGTNTNSTYIFAIRPLSTTVTGGGWTNSAPSEPAITPLPAWYLSVTRSNGQLSVSWDQCNTTADWCSGGSEITEYAINLRAGGAWTRAKTITDPTNDSDLTIVANGGTNSGFDRWTVTLSNGISNSTAYLVSVGSYNRMGASWVNKGPLSPFTS